MSEATLGAADLHLHTDRSDGLPTLSQLLDQVEHATDLDVIAVTDHDEFHSGLEARELAARRGYRFEVVPGAEITTSQGHLLGLFMEGPVAPYRSLAYTVAEVQGQGGLCVIPHPFSWLTRSIGQRALERVLAAPAGARPDAIELANPSLAGRVTATRARAWSVRHGLAQTGGSDAHFLAAVGQAYTSFPGRTAAELRRALQQGQTRGVFQAGRRRGPSWGELARQGFRAYVLKPSLPAAILRRYRDARRP